METTSVHVCLQICKYRLGLHFYMRCHIKHWSEVIVPYSLAGHSPIVEATGETIVVYALYLTSQFRWSHQLGGDVAAGLVSFILVLQLEGDLKKTVTLFEKSRWRRSRCHGLFDLCRHRSGWARCDQKHWLIMKWVQECAFTCWRPISPLWFLRNSAIGFKWGKLAPHIFSLTLRTIANVHIQSLI